MRSRRLEKKFRYRHCVGDTQSPINIKTVQISVEIYPYPDAYRFIFDNTVGSVSGVLVNNGHAPTLIVDQVKTPVTFIGGPWGAHTPYKLQQINFHFGCDASRGSERAVDGMVYSGEVRGFNVEKNSYINCSGFNPLQTISCNGFPV